jgi:uncharacterized SAM-binding protein YcdF (DUF218 family)
MRAFRSMRTVALTLIGVAVFTILSILALGWFIAPSDKLEKVDAIVVVSGGDTATRTTEGIRLWKAGYAPTLALAGAAADQGTSNAAVMRQQALAAGVPSSAILIEEKSTSTQENAEFLKPLTDAAGIKRIMLVTSPYHARRVEVTFQKAYGNGYEFLVHPATDSKWRRSSWWHNADTTALTFDEFTKTFYTAFLQR